MKQIRINWMQYWSYSYLCPVKEISSNKKGKLFLSMSYGSPFTTNPTLFNNTCILVYPRQAPHSWRGGSCTITCWFNVSCRFVRMYIWPWTGCIDWSLLPEKRENSNIISTCVRKSDGVWKTKTRRSTTWQRTRHGPNSTIL